MSFPLKLFPGLREMGECVLVFVVMVVAVTLADEVVEEVRQESLGWVVAGVKSGLPPADKEEQTALFVKHPKANKACSEESKNCDIRNKVM